jgi:hypothetical protein
MRIIYAPDLWRGALARERSPYEGVRLFKIYGLLSAIAVKCHVCGSMLVRNTRSFDSRSPRKLGSRSLRMTFLKIDFSVFFVSSGVKRALRDFAQNQGGVLGTEGDAVANGVLD